MSPEWVGKLPVRVDVPVTPLVEKPSTFKTNEGKPGTLQAKKDFFRQICRTAGHAEETPSGRCSRCKKRIRQGWVIYEQVGMVGINAKGVSQIIT